MRYNNVLHVPSGPSTHKKNLTLLLLDDIHIGLVRNKLSLFNFAIDSISILGIWMDTSSYMTLGIGLSSIVPNVNVDKS